MSDNDTKKYREYWIVTFESGRQQISDKEVKYDQEFFGPENYDKAILPRNIIHVIEHTALVELQAKYDEKSAYASSLLNEYDNLVGQYDSLKEKADKLRDSAHTLFLDMQEEGVSQLKYFPLLSLGSAIEKYDQRGEV